MTSDNVVSRFLEIEQQTTALLDELVKLRDETNHYSTASAAMDTAMRQFATVTESLTKLSGRLGEVVETLRSIGTPELIADLRAVQDEVKELRNELHSFRTESTSQMKMIADYERRGFFAKLFGAGLKPN